SLFFSMPRPPLRFTLFPYTTLFRSRVVPHAQLGEATMALATKLAQQAPLAQRLAKEALRVGLNLNLPYFFGYQRHGQHLMLTSKDHLEGARSFLEKRAAKLKGE